MYENLVSIDDLTGEDVGRILDLADDLKTKFKAYEPHRLLDGQSLAMVFEKPSLRTQATFEIGMSQLGGHTVYLGPDHIQMGKRESVGDVGRNLERWVDGIMARTFKHESVAELAEVTRVPVINALTDHEHPCQALALAQAVRNHFGDLRGRTIAYIGDGNNVAHSVMLFAVKAEMKFRLAGPKGYEPDQSVVQTCIDQGGDIELLNSPENAVAEADVIYTDVWASMGKEHEADRRRRAFSGFQINSKLMDAAPDRAIVSHCLPAHRGEEITDSVLDSERCVAFDEAECRLHVQKAVMVELMQRPKTK